MSKELILIACSIFQEELEYIFKKEKPDIKVRWLEVGLHDNIERLEETLDENLKEIQDSGGKAAFLYGWACLPEMKAFAAARGVKALSVKNCLAALVGDAKLKDLEQNKTMLASPGWLRKMWLGRVGTPGGWTEVDYRMQYGRYDLILLLDTGINPLSDEEILQAYDLVQVPIELMPCDMEHFEKVFFELINAAQ